MFFSAKGFVFWFHQSSQHVYEKTLSKTDYNQLKLAHCLGMFIVSLGGKSSIRQTQSWSDSWGAWLAPLDSLDLSARLQDHCCCSIHHWVAPKTGLGGSGMAGVQWLSSILFLGNEEGRSFPEAPSSLPLTITLANWVMCPTWTSHWQRELDCLNQSWLIPSCWAHSPSTLFQNCQVHLILIYLLIILSGSPFISLNY